MRERFGLVLRVCVFLPATVLLTGGCVSLDEYRQLEFAQRKCEAERVRLKGELATEKVQNTDLRNRLSRLQGDLSNRQQQLRMLEDQLKAGKDTLSTMAKVYEDLAARQIPTGEVLAVPLPPELDTALKDFAGKYPDMVQYDSERGVLKFGSDVLFDLGSDNVSAGGADRLRELADIIASPAAAEFDAVIVGHTDNIPIVKPSTKAKHPTNWHLSVHRSIAVKNVLQDGGVPPTRMGVMGYGEYRPAAPNDTRANRAMNRRVEVFLVPSAKTVGKSAPSAPSGKQPPRPIEK